MNEDIGVKKADVRKYCLAQRALLSESERRNKSLLIEKKLTEMWEFRKAHTVMLFLNFRDEVETTDLAEWVIGHNKQLVLPRCASKGILQLFEVRDLSTDLESGAWGIREPKRTDTETDPKEIDIVVVPGVGFDRQGNRLGYGGGFYDRLFTRLKPNTPRLALAFECQIISNVPVDIHDAKMTKLITEKAVYEFNEQRLF